MRITVLAAGVLLAACRLAGAAGPAAPPEGRREGYSYQAVPRNNAWLRENSRLSLRGAGGGSVYSSVTDAPWERQEIEADLDGGGEPAELERRVYSNDGELLRHERVRREGERVSLWDLKSGGAPRTYELRAGRKFSVGETLAVLLRGFPFGGGGEWEIFALDPAGRHITVTARELRPESVTVPAGKFDCYLIELTVNIPLLKPKIYCWLSRQPPHFLVRQRGKRGPFSYYYETVLTGKD